MEDFLAAFAFALLIAGQFSGVIAAYGMPDHTTRQKSHERSSLQERSPSSAFIR